MLFSANTTRTPNFSESGLNPKATPADIEDSEISNTFRLTEKHLHGLPPQNQQTTTPETEKVRYTAPAFHSNLF